MLIQTIAATAIVVLLISLITVIIWLRLRGHNALSGQPPIPVWAFVVGKLSMATSIVLMLLRALGVSIGPKVPVGFQAAALMLLLAGTGFAIPSLFQLGEELRFGLSQQQNTIKSTGLYGVSRNPLYLGFYLIAFASCLYVPHIVNLVLVAIALSVHHRVILAEERFLHQHFGKTYVQYAARVRRYL